MECTAQRRNKGSTSWFIFGLVILLGLVVRAGAKTTSKTGRNTSSSRDYAALVLKTCQGCALTSYPAVVKFIKYDIPRFAGQISVNNEAGGKPRLVVLNSQQEQVRVLDISKLGLKQIRQVAKQLGFEPKQPLLAINYVIKKYKTDVLLRGKDEPLPRENEVTRDETAGSAADRGDL